MKNQQTDNKDKNLIPLYSPAIQYEFGTSFWDVLPPKMTEKEEMFCWELAKHKVFKRSV